MLKFYSEGCPPFSWKNEQHRVDLTLSLEKQTN